MCSVVLAQIWILGGGGSISSVGGGGSVFPASCVSLSVCPCRRRCGEVAAAFSRCYCWLRSCRRCVRVGCSVPRVLVLVFGGGALLPLWWWPFLCGDGVGGVRLWCFEVGGVPSCLVASLRCLVFDGYGVWWPCYDGVFGLEVRLGGGVGELQWQCWQGRWCCRLFSGSGGDSENWWRRLGVWCYGLAKVVFASGGVGLRWWFG